ncbi:MAG: hypothetical protein MI742_16200 [Desulfobacterales bacterium]|nr:hypothetical protein [Desulfobacterales bacterium]
MPRAARMVQTDPGEEAVYHIMSRTALDGLPFQSVEKDEMVRTIKFFSDVFAVDVYGYAVMGNHFHLLVGVHPASSLSDDEVKRRYFILYGKGETFPEGRLEHYRERFTCLSSYVKEIKQRFSCFYNRRHKRRGTLWGERFKSVMVEKGTTLANCLAYVDLNAVRAGIVKRPEDYRWCSVAYHAQTGNRDAFLSTDFGLAQFGVGEKERFRAYRAFLYHAGGVDKKGRGKLSGRVLLDAALNDYEMGSLQIFRFRCRYFTDSGAIGSKAFVDKVFSRFKERFGWTRVRKPKHVKGEYGFYSLKRLSDTAG